MKAGDATGIVVLAVGAVAVYYLYKTLNKAGQTACEITQGLLHPNCVVANSVVAANNWLKCELGVNCCQIGGGGGQ
jgi:hypothetical protein